MLCWHLLLGPFGFNCPISARVGRLIDKDTKVIEEIQMKTRCGSVLCEFLHVGWIAAFCFENVFLLLWKAMFLFYVPKTKCGQS